MDIRFQSVIPNVQLEKEVGLLHFLQGRDGVLGDRDELRRRLREDRLADAGALAFGARADPTGRGVILATLFFLPTSLLLQNDDPAKKRKNGLDISGLY